MLFFVTHWYKGAVGWGVVSDALHLFGLSLPQERYLFPAHRRVSNKLMRALMAAL